MALVIRRCNDDWALLSQGIALLQEYLVETDPRGWLVISPDYVRRQAALVFDLVAKHNGAIFVAEVDGNFAGLVTGFVVSRDSPNHFGLVFDQIGIIGDVAVDESYRGTGIGRVLVERMEQYLRGQGCDVFSLVVMAFNPAMGFYEHLGYLPTEIRCFKPA